MHLFSLDNVGKSPSRFDPKKLANMNGIYLREADDQRLADLIEPMLQERYGEMFNQSRKETVLAAMPQLKMRAKSVHELVDGAAFLFKQRPLEMEDKAQAAIASAPDGLLKKIFDKLQHLDDWTLENLENVVKEFVETENLGFGKVAQPLRASLTGANSSPGIFDVLVLLGRDESLSRISDHM